MRLKSITHDPGEAEELSQLLDELPQEGDQSPSEALPEPEVEVLLASPETVQDEPASVDEVMVTTAPREVPRYVIATERDEYRGKLVGITDDPNDDGPYYPLDVNRLSDPDYRARCRRFYDFPSDVVLQSQFGITLAGVVDPGIDFDGILVEFLK